jgi:hypothetical protein
MSAWRQKHNKIFFPALCCKLSTNRGNLPFTVYVKNLVNLGRIYSVSVPLSVRDAQMPQIFTKVVVKLWIVYYAFLYMISLVTCIYYNNNVWIRIRIIICINFWCNVANGYYTIKSISKVNKWLCAFFPLSYDMFSATICFSHIIVCCMCNNCETCEL